MEEKSYRKMRKFFRITTMIFLLNGMMVFVFAQGAGSSLDFDASDDYVNIGTAANLARTGDLTIEAWVNITSVPGAGDNYTIICHGDNPGSETEATNILYKLAVFENNSIGIQHEHGVGVNDNVFATTSMVGLYGEWVHIAVTRNTTTQQYEFIINGIAEGARPTYGALNNPTGGGSGTAIIGAGFASGATGTTTVPQDVSYLLGEIDEVRVWDDIRTLTEIRDNMNKKVGTGEGLIACWRMDEGSGQTVSDLTSNNYDGTRGAGSGSASDDPAWATSTAPIGDESDWTISAAAPATLEITNEDLITVTPGTDPDFLALIRVDEGPNYSGVGGALAHVDPIRYYEVWMSGGTDYDFEYDYDGHPGITNTSTLELGIRTDASVTSWSDASATPATNTLTLSGETASGQYILASTAAVDNPLPILLTSFTANAGDAKINLNWETGSEIDNQGFIILGSTEEYGDYQEIDSYLNNDVLKGAGNSSHNQKYSYTDRYLQNGVTYYYKLLDVSVNGRRVKHGLVVSATPHIKGPEIITDQLPNEFALLQNFPNPFNPSTYIKFVIPKISDESASINVSIFNLLGEKVRTIYNGTIAPGRYELTWHGLNDANQPVPSGVYIYQLSSSQDNARYFKSMKMILLK